MPRRRSRASGPRFASVRRSFERIGWLRALLGALVIYLFIEYISLPNVFRLQTENPTTTRLMDLRKNEAEDVGRKLTIRQTWVPYTHVSSNLKRAVIVAEDSNFFGHGGFDFGELRRAVWDAVRHLQFPRGASTITQQLAKNLYLSESRSPIRKLKEVVLTNRLEASLSKRRILELYLNLIEWGDGIFGAEAAARTYFGKSAHDLTESDAAFLAAIIPNPRGLYNPRLHPRRVSSRQRIILRRMGTMSVPGI